MAEPSRIRYRSVVVQRRLWEGIGQAKVKDRAGKVMGG